MTKYFIVSFLLCLFLEINGNMFQDPGRYIEKYERYPEKEYYKKSDKDSHLVRVKLERDDHYPHYQKTYEENYVNSEASQEWRNKYVENSMSDDIQDKVIQYTKKNENKPKYEESEYRKKYDGEYKYKKDYQKYNSYPKKYEEDHKKMKRDHQEHVKDVQENKEKEHHYKHLRQDPPDHTKYIAMARFVVHQADWASVATLTVIPSIKGFPFTNIVSMSDGPIETSSGIPYFYLTPLDFTHKDITNDNRCTVSVSLAETGYCADKKWDADDPRCSRIMLTGKIQRLSNDTKEYAFAKNALFTRHPSMAHLPADHDFYVAKLKIGNIVMLDWFGGPKFIDIRDYLNFKPTEEKVENFFEDVLKNEKKSAGQGHDISP